MMQQKVLEMTKTSTDIWKGHHKTDITTEAKLLDISDSKVDLFFQPLRALHIIEVLMSFDVLYISYVWYFSSLP